ncbi:sigma-70 family RNA polymerase sigma factor [Dongia sp.]|uniref:sigma-70 family RNA polymerase sigma factor n=1 Tax=Dongia sp. TaxID=1977262 RepID=UPI0035B23C99
MQTNMQPKADTFQNQLVATLPAMTAFAVMLTRNRPSADDLVHDTVVRALSREELFTPGTNLKAWLFTIMRNLHINNLRAGHRSRIVDIDDDLLPNLASAAPNQEHRLVLKELFQAIGGLNQDQQEVLSLVVGQDMSYEEAAEICGCPIGTIRSRLARARRELERMLAGDVAMPAAQPAAKPRRRGAAPMLDMIEELRAAG